MKYKHEEVLDIIKQLTDKNPNEILKNWNINKSNTPLDLSKGNYPQFVYSFPLIINNESVATITLVSLYGGSLNSEKPDLMQKYFGNETYNKSWWAFSHDTYLDCYLTIHKDFELPEIVEGFYGGTYKSIDSNNQEFSFNISYGNPEKESDSYMYTKYANNSYRFDNDVNIQVDKMSGWSLGERINRNIEMRLRDIKIESILDI